MGFDNHDLALREFRRRCLSDRKHRAWGTLMFLSVKTYDPGANPADRPARTWWQGKPALAEYLYPGDAPKTALNKVLADLAYLRSIGAIVEAGDLINVRFCG